MSEPTATYRLQLRREFGFEAATEVLDYLSDLGISHVYLSPITKAVEGSVHGYDVVDPAMINPELGGESGFRIFAERAHRLQMGVIVDVVPNHMATAGKANAWLWDVLRNGRDSPFSHYFDIDWSSPDDRIRNTILLPVLGDHYGRVLERGELKLGRHNGEVVVEYFDNTFPIDPTTMKEVDLAVLNNDVEKLDALIGAQHYRLAYWTMASEELDYRRFFDIDSLIALRNEDDDVFAATHGLVERLVRDGLVDGVRVDHVDGLHDPTAYLRALRNLVGDKVVYVEKILEAGEQLPVAWPVEGTTGYEASSIVESLFVEPEAEHAFDELYSDFTGLEQPWEELVLECKRLVLQDLLASDVERLTSVFVKVCQERRRFRDFTRRELRSTLIAALCAMPVYRTYVQAETSQLGSTDARLLEVVCEQAQMLDPSLDSELFALLFGVLRLELAGEAETELVMRFQQLSGPVMAKSLEDTAFYRYGRFVAKNEVGNAPDTWALRQDDFHEFCSSSQKMFPLSMLAGSTHDSKRSADVRLRLCALSMVPYEWRAAVEKWRDTNDVHRSGDLPDRNSEYVLYQTLVGAHPLSEDRAVTYVLKAARESKQHTSWVERNEEYEDALERFVRSACNNARFTASLDAFVASIEPIAHLNSLAATALRFTMPGVPDTYQGDEHRTFTLVDPDNRGIVDFSGASVSTDIDDVRLQKSVVMHRCADLRRRRADCFGPAGTYEPVFCTGIRAANVVAFSRRGAVVTVVPRVVRPDVIWGDTVLHIAQGRWRNIFTNEEIDGGEVGLARLFAAFPVAVLERTDR